MKQHKQPRKKFLSKEVRIKSKYLLVVLVIVFGCGLLTAVYQVSKNSASLSQTKIISNEDEVGNLSGGNKATNQSPTSSAGNNSSSQTGTQCSTVDIPYGTTRQSAIWLYVGQTEVANRGITGKKKVCTSASGTRSETVVSKAYDEVINVGTKPKEAAATPTAPQYTYAQALSKANAYCDPIYIANGSYDSTDRGNCVRNELRKYGY